MNQRPSILVFVGPPGSGKGTLAQQCVQSLGWVQLSTGNLCRKAIAEGSPIGKEIAAAIDAGTLVSDTLISAMVEQWLAQQLDNGKTIILDGYPRARTQANLLHEFLQGRLGNYMKVIRFVVPHEVIIRRLTARLVCANKECQRVYSSDRESCRVASHPSFCDACGTTLVKRNDDNIQTVKERLLLYDKHEQDLLDFYQAHGESVIELGSDGSSGWVFEQFCAMMGVVRA